MLSRLHCILPHPQGDFPLGRDGLGHRLFTWTTPHHVPRDAPAALPLVPLRLPTLHFPGPAGVLCLLIIICYSASGVVGYLTLPVLEMVLAGFLFVIFMLNKHHQLQFINWPWSDFFRALIASVLFFIASLITIIKNVDAQSMVGGVLGLVATILFAYDAYSTFQGQRSHHTPAATESPDGPS
ncbi:proteolipid protein 2 isoform X1 [Phascolarctos cinereus]|uniref:Proteolipid protein 2 n=1 Tax=Phascolarctos cinereus TaxID=38626 RepID=A0A6P5JDA8_PHACI|nr:proteolipid protein 2 isoform X1 [Phascolarctos cinereus]